MHENRGQTIRALTTILPELHRRGLRSVSFPELLASDPPSPAQLNPGGGCGGTSPRAVGLSGQPPAGLQLGKAAASGARRQRAEPGERQHHEQHQVMSRWRWTDASSLARPS